MAVIFLKIVSALSINRQNIIYWYSPENINRNYKTYQHIIEMYQLIKFPLKPQVICFTSKDKDFNSVTESLKIVRLPISRPLLRKDARITQGDESWDDMRRNPLWTPALGTCQGHPSLPFFIFHSEAPITWTDLSCPQWRSFSPGLLTSIRSMRSYVTAGGFMPAGKFFQLSLSVLFRNAFEIAPKSDWYKR